MFNAIPQILFIPLFCPYKPKEIIVALAGISTAVVLLPLLKKQNETFALGLVAARILESSTIFVGVAFILSIVTLRQVGAGAEAVTASHALIALYNRIFLLGQSFMPAVCDLLLGFLLYKSRLVPRGLSLFGIVGAPVLVVGYIAVLFGLIGRLDPFACFMNCRFIGSNWKCKMMNCVKPKMS
jgi:hypothetical protein